MSAFCRSLDGGKFFGQLFQHLKKTFNFLLFNIVFALDIIPFLY